MFLGTTEKYNQKLEMLAKMAQPNGFFKETNKFFTTNFSMLPPLADYCDNAKDLIFDNSLEVNLRKEHIIDDNIERFIEAGYSNKELISVLLDSAKVTLEKKLKRNFKLALPFYYRNTDTGECKIQLLAPLYFPGAPVRLALVLNKIKTEAQEYYEGVTVLPVEWAYMNSRLIVKPDEEWAKIIEDIDSGFENETIQETIDKVEMLG